MNTWVTRSLILLNAAVAAWYLWLGHSWWWIQPELQSIPGASGGAPVIWFIATAYIFGAMVLVDGAILGWHLHRVKRRKSKLLGAAALWAIPLWLVTVVIDFAHH